MTYQLLVADSIQTSTQTSTNWYPIIAALGVIISAAASFIVSRWQVNAKMQELKEQYSHRLHEKRLEVYPALYKITARLGTCLENEKTSKEVLEPLFRELIDWDHNNAVLAGQRLISKLFNARISLHNVLENSDNTQYHEKLEKLFKSLCDLQYELKREIGVFNIENFDREMQLEQRQIYDNSFNLT